MRWGIKEETPYGCTYESVDGRWRLVPFWDAERPGSSRDKIRWEVFEAVEPPAGNTLQEGTYWRSRTRYPRSMHAAKRWVLAALVEEGAEI